MTKARNIASANPAPTTVSTTELGYVDGVTSAIQTQLNQKPESANPILNSAFQVWQRSTSITVGTAFTYTADRWLGNRASLVTGQSVSRQVTGDTTNLPNIQYCARVQRVASNTGLQSINLSQSFESINSIAYAGKTVTLSGYFRAGANYSGSTNWGFQLSTGTGTDQNLTSTGFTGQATPINITGTLTTTWQRFQATATLSSSATQIGLLLFYVPSGTAGAADYIEMTGVQLEVGSVATPFKTNQPTIATELAACQRYFQRLINGEDNSNEGLCTGQARSSTGTCTIATFFVPMRSAPSFTASAVGHFSVGSSIFTDLTVTALSYEQITTRHGRINATVASGLTAGNASIFKANVTASATLDVSAEL